MWCLKSFVSLILSKTVFFKSFLFLVIRMALNTILTFLDSLFSTAGSKGIQVFTEGCKGYRRLEKLYRVTGCYKGYRGLQWITKGYSGLQGVIRGYRGEVRFQLVTGGLQRFSKENGTRILTLTPNFNASSKSNSKS